MPRTREELEQAAEEARAWLDQLDPATTPMEDTSDLRAVAEAQDAVVAALRHLETTVKAARVKGRSWGRIGLSLGVSRQAAQERFDKRGPEPAPVPDKPKRVRARVSTAAGSSLASPAMAGAAKRYASAKKPPAVAKQAKGRAGS